MTPSAKTPKRRYMQVSCVTAHDGTVMRGSIDIMHMPIDSNNGTAEWHVFVHWPDEPVEVMSCFAVKKIEYLGRKMLQQRVEDGHWVEFDPEDDEIAQLIFEQDTERAKTGVTPNRAIGEVVAMREIDDSPMEVAIKAAEKYTGTTRPTERRDSDAKRFWADLKKGFASKPDAEPE
jgi:hypothetical protein